MYGGYDGSASQFAGQGGFMPSPAGGVAGASPSAEGGRGQGRSESLLPLTVKQLKEAISATSMDDVFRVNGEEVHNLTLLGKIVDFSDSSTSLTYTIDDGSGKVDVKIWVEAEDSEALAQNKAEWRVGKYVRVYGHLRSFQGQRSVVAFTMRPVTDFNEITFHLLEVVFCNNHNASKMSAAGAGATPGEAVKSEPMANNAYSAPAAGAAAPAGGANTGTCADQALAVFNSPQGASDQGLHINEVVNHLNGRFTEGDVRGAVEFLVNEGHLYSTIDDDHFKSTAM